jgi:serine/threonine protein kinase
VAPVMIRSGHYCMVMEPLGRSLYDVIKDNDYTGFGIAAVREFARQLLEALDFLQRMNLIHTDLKPENVLLTTNTFRAESKNGKPYRIPINTSIKCERTCRIRCAPLC